MHNITLFHLANHENDTRPHIKWAVNLMITDVHFNLRPQSWVCVGVYGLMYTHFITPGDRQTLSSGEKSSARIKKICLTEEIFHKEYVFYS